MLTRKKKILTLVLTISAVFFVYNSIGRNESSKFSIDLRRETDIAKCVQLYSQRLLANKTLLRLSRKKICSDVLTDPHYKDFISTSLRAWHEFVPHPHTLDPSNCWYSEHTPPKLPDNLTSRMKLLYRFVDVDKTFQQSEMKLTVEKMQNSTLPATKTITDTHFCLPTTYLIGVSKCGTTLLYEHIAAHPMVAKPHTKEGQFWREFVQTQEHFKREFDVVLYLYHFLNASTMIQKDPSKFTLDASASTIFTTLQPLREAEKDICVVPLMLARALPKVKLLVIMRNPIDRLWSDFWYFCSRERWKKGKVYNVPEKVILAASETFHNLTVAAIREFTECIDNGHSQFHCTALAGSYPGKEGACERVRLGLSLYYIHLVKWYSVFPKDQILPVKFENLVSNPSETMATIWPFLEVPAINVTLIKKPPNANEWIYSSPYNEHFKMWPETQSLLYEFFRPYNLALAELLRDRTYLWN